jgi:hypothetical protein
MKIKINKLKMGVMSLISLGIPTLLLKHARDIRKDKNKFG